MSAGEGWSQGIGIGLTVLVTSWMMRAMVEASRRPIASDAGGAVELRYPRWFAWLGAALALLGAVMAVAGGIATAHGSLAGFLLVLGVGLAMAAGGGWMTLEMLRRRVRVSTDGVQMIDLRGVAHTLPWPAVQRVRFRKMAGYLVLEGREGTTIQASVAMLGLQSLIDTLKAKVAESQWGDALRDLEEYRTRQGAR